MLHNKCLSLSCCKKILTILEAGNAKVSYLLVKALFLACRQMPPHCIFTWQRERDHLLVSPQKATNVIQEGFQPHDLITSRKPHLQISSQCELDFDMRTWSGEHKHSIPSNKMPTKLVARTSCSQVCQSVAWLGSRLQATGLTQTSTMCLGTSGVNSFLKQGFCPACFTVQPGWQAASISSKFSRGRWPECKRQTKPMKHM